MTKNILCESSENILLGMQKYFDIDDEGQNTNFLFVLFFVKTYRHNNNFYMKNFKSFTVSEIFLSEENSGRNPKISLKFSKNNFK